MAAQGGGRIFLWLWLSRVIRDRRKRKKEESQQNKQEKYSVEE